LLEKLIDEFGFTNEFIYASNNPSTYTKIPIVGLQTRYLLQPNNIQVYCSIICSKHI